MDVEYLYDVPLALEKEHLADAALECLHLPCPKAGKINASRYAREHNVPFLGLCLGMQLAIIEFSRNIIGYTEAHSVELDPFTPHPLFRGFVGAAHAFRTEQRYQ